MKLEIRGSLGHIWEQLTNPAGFPGCEQPQELHVQGLGSRGALSSVGGKCLPGLFPGRRHPEWKCWHRAAGGPAGGSADIPYTR